MAELVKEHSHGVGAVIPAASRASQFASFDVDAFEVPGGREEIWRFTPLKRLRDLHKGAEATGTATVDVSASAEVVVETVPRSDERLGKAGTPDDRIAAQAWSSFVDATVVTVPKETRPETIFVKVAGPGEGEVAYGHLLVRVEQFAEAVVVVDHRGSGTYADNVEFVVGDGARLNVVSIQDWADDAVHVSSHHNRLGRDATLRHTTITLGGDVVRLSPTVTYAERGGDAELLGLYFADAGQHFE